MQQEFDVETVPMRAKAALWDPADPEPFLRLAGTRYLRAEGDLAITRNDDGTEDSVYPGWAVIRPDGSGDGEAIFTAQWEFGGDGTPRGVWRLVP
jgi:hypothetical protein